MGATTSVQRDAKSSEDATPDEQCAEVNDTQDGEIADEKLQKNGQVSVSSLNGKTDEQTEFNGLSDDNALPKVGQTDATPQKEDSPETIEVLQDEVSPQVNGEQGESECVNADKTTAVEEKVVEEKPTEANEVGFKKIFRFVGFKFTLKKDKNEKTEPVQLLTVKETEDGASEVVAVESKEETVEAKPEKENIQDTTETEKEVTAKETADVRGAEDLPETAVPTETVTDSAAAPEETHTEQPGEEVATAPEKESEVQAESPTSPSSQEAQSSFKRFFTQGIFSNLRKKTSFKKSKEEEPAKEKSAEEDIKETDEKAEEVATEKEQVKDDVVEGAADRQVEKSEAPEEIKAEASQEEALTTTEEPKEEEPKVQATVASETEAPKAEPVAQTCEDKDTIVAVDSEEIKPIDDTTPADDKPSDSAEGQQSPEKSPTDVTTEAEVPSPQDKVKTQGSPLKKLFTGAGLKKLSKKQKGKKETESKVTESGEQVVEQIQSTAEAAEAQKHDSGPSSPEESGEHVVEEAPQAEAAVDGEVEAVTSDNEKKKDGILPWASFKKLVTPKKHVKRSSESEDEAPCDKPKSATLSSTESATLDDKTEEPKPSDEVNDEPKDESQIESKTETKAEKAEQSMEEPKRKMDTSVSWEALICVGSAKKRARKTSDSDDEETKIEEEVQQSGEEQAKTTESPLTSSQEAERENVASSPEPEGELVSTWESFKRLVTQRKKPKAEDKCDEASGPEQTTSDTEIPKEESSFSLRKLIPRRKKKSVKQGQVSSDVGSGEEDSDTPAVVPLSEYDNEQPDKDVADEVKTDETKTEITPVTPAKVSAEDRSPSWISATVEDNEDEAQGKQLSDIPEEGDTAATPKSADNTIAEDIVDFTSEAVTALEPAEETEMVSAMSRITASPVTSGETTPVPGDVVVQTAETVGSISVTSSTTAVTVTEEQKTVIPASSSTLQVESAIKDENVLVAQEKTEVICTGLEASEIKGVEEESPLKASVEPVTAVGKALSMEIVEEQTIKPEEAGVSQDFVFEAQVNEVQMEYKEESQVPVENAVDNAEKVEAVKETSETETVNEFQQATAVKVAVVNAIQQEAEILEEPVVSVKILKEEAEGSLEPTLEESVCVQTVEVTETAVSEIEQLKDVNDSATSVEVASAEDVVMVALEEKTTSLADEPVTDTTESKEDTTPVAPPTKESAMTEDIILVIPTSESKPKGEVKDETITKEVPVIVTAGHCGIQDTVKEVEIVSANVVVERHVEDALSNAGALVEVCEKAEEEVSYAMHAKEEEAIQEQSTVIVQEIIQNVVENLDESNIEQLPGKSSITVAEEATMPEEVPTASEKLEEKTTTVISAEEDKLETDVAAGDMSVPEEKPVEDVLVHEEKADTVDLAVQEGKPIAEIIVEEEKLPTESISDKPITPETDGRDDEKQTQVIIESSPQVVSEAIQISDLVADVITDEIKAQHEEVSTVSTDAMQEGTYVIKQEGKLGEVEKKVEEETVGKSTELDGKSGAEKDLKEVPTENQKVSTDTLAAEASAPDESCERRATQAQAIEEQCQQVQDIQTKTMMEMNVGVINVVDTSEEPVKDTEPIIKEDHQEPLEDGAQAVLDEAQKNISTQDRKGQKGSGDAACQKTDAEAGEAKKAAEEDAIKEVVTQEVGHKIDPISIETTTVS